MSKPAPIVAIVGRANVGKSSLFNRMVGMRQAIVAEEAGTTRDSIQGKVSHSGKDFWLVDTAGLKTAEDDFEFTIQEQIIQATDSADVILVVIEAHIPITDEDRRVATMALKSKKPVILVANKADKVKRHDLDIYRKLGIKQIFLTSAHHGHGIEELLNTVVQDLPKRSITQDDNRLRIALIGRPNVGKSQLFNTLAKKQQAVVADRAGTTRDVNRSVIRYFDREIELLDTAGVRRSGKIEVGIEKFSVLRTLKAIEEADVCLMLMDVAELNVQMDMKLAGMIKEAGKGLILVVTKWDTYKTETRDQTPETGEQNIKDTWTHDKLLARVAEQYEFVHWAPIIFTSALDGHNVTKLLDLSMDIDHRRQQRLKTSDLNRWLHDVTLRHPPAGLKNKHPRLNYMTQITEDPGPAFKIFGASTEFLHWSYKRHMEHSFRDTFDFEGTPIRFYFLEKHGEKIIKPKFVPKRPK